MSKSAQSSKAKQKVPKTTKKTKKSFHSKLIGKKPYIEFITAFLSIPVLITVMLLNVNSLKNMNAKPTPTPPIQNNYQSGFYAAPVGVNKTPLTVTGATPAPCVKGLGTALISSPGEGDIVTDNPVTIDINYDDRIYCAAAWSYSINGGSWSGYDDRSVALYNLPQGPVKFELRVKSIAGGDEKSISRNFTYNGQGNVLIPQTASDSAR